MLKYFQTIVTTVNETILLIMFTPQSHISITALVNEFFYKKSSYLHNLYCVYAAYDIVFILCYSIDSLININGCYIELG